MGLGGQGWVHGLRAVTTFLLILFLSLSEFIVDTEWIETLAAGQQVISCLTASHIRPPILGLVAGPPMHAALVPGTGFSPA